MELSNVPIELQQPFLKSSFDQVFQLQTVPPSTAAILLPLAAHRASHMMSAKRRVGSAGFSETTMHVVKRRKVSVSHPLPIILAQVRIQTIVLPARSSPAAAKHDRPHL